VITQNCDSHYPMKFLRHLTNEPGNGSFLHPKIKLRFEVEDHIGTTVFMALDREVQKL
ncbi:hypothetical protein MKX03_019353, partial [Papaver bracteatum]